VSRSAVHNSQFVRWEQTRATEKILPVVRELLHIQEGHNPAVRFVHADGGRRPDSSTVSRTCCAAPRAGEARRPPLIVCDSVLDNGHPAQRRVEPATIGSWCCDHAPHPPS
jgi:hypothetical protein